MKILKNVLLVIISCLLSYWLVGGALVDLLGI